MQNRPHGTIVSFMNSEHVFANALNTIEELGASRLSFLKQFFDTFENAWNASENRLGEALRDSTRASTVVVKRRGIDPKKEYQILKQRAISVFLHDDAAYPPVLRNIPTPPAILYVDGSLPSFEKMPALAVVGTRTPTSYGMQACQSIVEPVAAAGVCIISGLATGIDTEAHKSCLKAGGTTLAVVGSGLERSVIYPAGNARLADTIVANGGAIISEYPLTMKPASWTFPQRNRIIAGLAAATLVVEAKEKSGARITARYALDFGKDVFAIPGSIFSATSKTPHLLIQDGATPITSARDVLFALGIENTAETHQNSSSANTPEEVTVLDFLSEPRSANDIARSSDIHIGTVNGLLMNLEIRGMVKNMGGGVYRRC